MRPHLESRLAGHITASLETRSLMQRSAHVSLPVAGLEWFVWHVASCSAVMQAQITLSQNSQPAACRALVVTSGSITQHPFRLGVWKPTTSRSVRCTRTVALFVSSDPRCSPRRLWGQASAGTSWARHLAHRCLSSTHAKLAKLRNSQAFKRATAKESPQCA